MKDIEPDVSFDALPGFMDVKDLLAQPRPTIVRSFHIRRWVEDGAGQCEVLVDLVHDYADPEAVRFIFTHARDIRLGGCHHQITGLVICDISRRGWETRYELRDYENDVIALHCKAVTLERVVEG